MAATSNSKLRLGMAFGLALIVVSPMVSQAQGLKLAEELVAEGRFIGKKGKAAEDLSGIACMPPDTAGARECLVINDEGRAAQRAALIGNRLIAKDPVPLIGDSPPADAVGTRPDVRCSGGAGEFGEFDGEAVTYAPGVAGTGGTYYVVGSHGCSRHKNETRLSSFLIARIPVDASGTPGTPELSWRLSDALRTNVDLRPAFARSLMNEDGLNIEGLAATGTDLVIGMRAPVTDGHAFIARLPVAALFASGASGEVSAEVTGIESGAHAGIRDLAMLPDGRLLVLSGPAQEQAEVSYALWVHDLQEKAKVSRPRVLGVLPDVPTGGGRAKAEGVVVLDTVGAETKVLVLFDGLKNGGPRQYLVELP